MLMEQRFCYVVCTGYGILWGMRTIGKLGVKVLEEGVDALQLVPFAPTQGVVLQSAVSPHRLVQVAELNDPLSDIERSSDGQEKAVPTGIIIFNELSLSQLTRTDGITARADHSLDHLSGILPQARRTAPAHP